MNRYAKQLALPELTQAHQDFLKNTKLLMVGAGGLGAPALPYLAGAGIGQITIADGDNVDISNLHRQTIFKESEAGGNKAICAANYIRALNPDISVTALPQKITSAEQCEGFDIILDGTDNFESKRLLNQISIQLKTPLVSASVEGFKGTAAIFAGHTEAPCYHCLFPELPIDCVNCNEAGILGTVAGLAGMYQAHLTLCFLLGLGEIGPGTVISMDFSSLRTQQLMLQKNPECVVCKSNQKPRTVAMPHIPLVPPGDLKDHIVIDVRTDEEVAMSPIEGAMHIRLDTIPERFAELPHDKLLAFACASNIRSRRAAEYLYAQGYTNVCVMDVLAA